MRKLLSVLLISCILLSGCDLSQKHIFISGYAFDTSYTITINDHASDTLAQSISELISYYNNLWHPEIEGSDIYKINHAHGETVTVGAETLSLIVDGLTFALQYDGAIDPSIGALSNLWDFDHNTHVPDEEDIKNALQHVGCDLIYINGYSIRLKDPEAQIDVGCNAKGYITDRIVEVLKDYGVNSAIINLGGNVYCLGKKGNELYKVGIKDPLGESEYIKALSVSDYSVVTSGIYERGFRDNGVWYHHILDTKTGYPVQNNLLSVTIVGESSYVCDMLSTLCFIKGIEESKKLLKEYQGYEAIFYTQDKEIIETYSY